MMPVCGARERLARLDCPANTAQAAPASRQSCTATDAANPVPPQDVALMMQPVLLHLIQVWLLRPPLLLLLPLPLPLPATGGNSRDLHIERRVGHYVALSCQRMQLVFFYDQLLLCQRSLQLSNSVIHVALACSCGCTKSVLVMTVEAWSLRLTTGPRRTALMLQLSLNSLATICMHGAQHC